MASVDSMCVQMPVSVKENIFGSSHTAAMPGKVPSVKGIKLFVEANSEAGTAPSVPESQPALLQVGTAPQSIVHSTAAAANTSPAAPARDLQPPALDVPSVPSSPRPIPLSNKTTSPGPLSAAFRKVKKHNKATDDIDNSNRGNMACKDYGSPTTPSEGSGSSTEKTKPTGKLTAGLNRLRAAFKPAATCHNAKRTSNNSTALASASITTTTAIASNPGTHPMARSTTGLLTSLKAKLSRSLRFNSSQKAGPVTASASVPQPAPDSNSSTSPATINEPTAKATCPEGNNEREGNAASMLLPLASNTTALDLVNASKNAAAPAGTPTSLPDSSLVPPRSSSNKASLIKRAGKMMNKISKKAKGTQGQLSGQNKQSSKVAQAMKCASGSLS